MNDLVSFTCGACQATLSISAELAGITGPCPYCGTEVTSPKAASVPSNQPVRQKRGGAGPGVVAGMPWHPSHSMSQDETVVMRPRRTGLMVAAGFAIFAGGVAGAWKLWEPAENVAVVIESEKEPGAAEAPPVKQPAPRPEVLASANEDPLPPAADEMPQTNLTDLPAAMARNVSTTAAVAARVAPVASPDPKTSVSPVPVSPLSLSEDEKEIRRIVPATGHLEKPGAALIRFFSAKTWQERLKVSLAPEKVGKLMEAYYKEHTDGPIVPEDIELTRLEAMEDDPSRHYYAFLAFMPGKEEGIPVSVEETKSGCLVEWCTFIEGKDGLLAKFYGGYRKEPGLFRVLVRRGHYFEKDVPNQDGRVVFDISPPDASGPYKMWLNKDSEACKKYFATGQRTKWEISSMMVLSLQWEKAANGAEFVRLHDVVADTWHPAMLPK